MKKSPFIFKTLVICVIAVASYIIGKQSSVSNSVTESSLREASGATSHSVPEAQETEEIESKVPSLQELYNLRSYSERNFLFDQFLEDLKPENALALLEELENLRPSQKRSAMVGRFFRRWGELAGEEALNQAIQYRGYDGLLYQNYAIEGWAGQDPVSAWDMLMDLSNHGAVIMPRGGSVLVRIAEDNLSLAVSLSQKIKDPTRIRSTFSQLVGFAADTNQVPSVLAELHRIEDVKTKASMMEALFQDWGQVDSESSLTAANALEDETLMDSAMKGLMQGWAANDGKGALEYAIQHADDPLFQEIAVSVAQDWAVYANSKEVSELFETVRHAPNQAQILEKVIHFISRADPHQALSYVQAIEDIDIRGQNTGRVLWQLGRTDFASASEYFREIPDEEVKMQSAYSMFSNSIRAGQTPEETLSFLDEFSDPKLQMRALSSLAHNLVRPENLRKTTELRALVSQRLTEQEGWDPTAKQKLLDRLKVK